MQDWCISRQLWWGHRCPAWLLKFEGESPDVRQNFFFPSVELISSRYRPLTTRTGSLHELRKRLRKRPGPSPMARTLLWSKTMTCLTPGSLPVFGLSPLWAGQTRYAGPGLGENGN